MATGGVFTLIANDGKADRLIIATLLLNQRIYDVMCARTQAGVNPTPTLCDIEKTHILYVNAHFKPFAAIGYEYNKVHPGSGSPQLGGSIQFSIPQFGDFFHDMVIRMQLGPTYTGLLNAPAIGGTTINNYGVRSIFPADGLNWDNADVLLPASYALVDAFGSLVGAEETYRNMVKYVEYPAERAFAKVNMHVNGNPLDEYTYQTVMLLRKFTITDEKLRGYRTLCGQENAIEGVTGPRTCRIEDVNYDPTLPLPLPGHGIAAGPYAGAQDNVGKTPVTYMTAPLHAGGAELMANQWQYSTPTAAIPTQVTVDVGQVLGPTTGSPVGPAGAAYGHVQRGRLQAFDGPQTPKYWQPGLEIFNRLWFWFNTNARLSVPSVAIPYGQRYIHVDIAQASEIITDFPGLFVQQTVTIAELPGAGGGAALVNGTTYRNYRPYWQTSAIVTPTLTNVELYINNIFVNPEIHDIFISRVGFSLIRVYRMHTATRNQSGDQSELLSQFKWPIECIFLGMQPTFNASSRTNLNYGTDWHMLSKTFDSVCEMRQASVTSFTGPVGGQENTTNTSNIGQIVPDTYKIQRPVIRNLGLKAHGITIYDTVPAVFFSTYTPFHYGDTKLRPPVDSGALMLNFALFVGKYQPSGYLNVSRARELYIHWTGIYIDSSTPAQLIGAAIAINFLLVSDGSAVLRYST
jgi:hypothetical protein